MQTLTPPFLSVAFVRTLVHTYTLFKGDPRCSCRSLFNAARHAVCEDKPVRHDRKLVYTSFLPPLPSRAAQRAIESTDATHGLFEGFVTGRRLAPISMYVAVTGRCPYRCAHCSAAGLHEGQELDTVAMKKILSDVQNMGTAIIGLTGGEPLTRADLAELIASVDDRSVTYLFTSGFGMTPKKARELQRAGLFAVGVSLDSADAAFMDARRGATGAHERAVAAVRYCREAGLYTMTQTVAERETLGSGRLQEVVAFSEAIGAHEVRILESMPSGRLAKIDPNRILTAQERNALRKFHAETNRRKNGIKVAVFAHTESADRFGCGAGTQHSYIDAAGNLFPCDFVPLSFGNVLERPVAELWREMHRLIGKPRQTCMVMELYAKQLLAHTCTLPVSPAVSTQIVRRLSPETEMPGFYRRALGTRK